MPVSCENHEDEGDEINEIDAIPTASWRWWAVTELQRFDLGTRDVDRYEPNDGDNGDAGEKEEVLQPNDWLMLTLEDWGYSTRECEDCTVHFRPLKYDNGEANETASDLSEAKTVL